MWDKETDKEVVRAHEIRFHRNRNKETGRDLNENFSTNVDNVEHVWTNVKNIPALLNPRFPVKWAEKFSW